MLREKVTKLTKLLFAGATMATECSNCQSGCAGTGWDVGGK